MKLIIKKQTINVENFQIFFELVKGHKIIPDLKMPTKELESFWENHLKDIRITKTKLRRCLCVNVYFIRSHLVVKYWINKGWTEEEAKEKISQLQRNNSEASIDHWVKLGLNRQDAEEKVKQSQSIRGLFLSKKLKENHQFRREFSPSNIEFWLKRGQGENESCLSVEEFNKSKFKNNKESYIRLYGEEKGMAVWDRFVNGKSNENLIRRFGPEIGEQKIKSRNSRLADHRGREGFVRRYGEEIGEQKYEELLEKQKKMGDKDWYLKKFGDVEGLRLYTDKCKSIKESHSLEYIKMKYGEEDGIKRFYKWREDMVVKRGRASKASLLYFLKLYKILRKGYKIARKDIFLGISGSHEWFILSDGRFYLFDFVIRSKKIIIEFNGAHVHPKEDRKEENGYWENWRHPWSKEGAEEVLMKEKRKTKLAKDLGYSIYTLWSDLSFEENWEIINKMILENFILNLPNPIDNNLIL
ncbi:MAG: hypothetical protein M0P12_01235 [Paludibacteraceae bacterium]|nr:hypothetical protein [Paludibacteraceae bacterium]